MKLLKLTLAVLALSIAGCGLAYFLGGKWK
jgi:predicted small lipoprotein YifL